MTDCVAILGGSLVPKAMEHWTTTDIFESHILHVEPLRNVSVTGGELRADPFALPDAVHIKDVAGLAIFNCETKRVSDYGFQVPALGITCLEDRSILCLRGFCTEAPTIQDYESDCSILDDACALYKELRCCYLKLVKEQECVSIAFRDRNVRFQPKSEGDKVRLFEMMMSAKADCECDGTWRGGYLGRNCPPNYSRRFKQKKVLLR